MVDRAYIFADPFSRADSGVSSYIDNAMDVMHRNGIQAIVVPRLPNEALNLYRKRLAKVVINAARTNSSVIIEAPESDAVTADIPSGVADIHIRLHCSRQLGAFLQGETIDIKCHALEEKEIRRANLLSAPSHSAVIASGLLFDLPENICCYPNPAPLWAKSIKPEDLGTGNYVLFVGRFHTLKGANWIPELAIRLPDIRFLMAGPMDGRRDINATPPNLEFIDVSTWDKYDVYARAKLVIIPSLYETASMVGIEALASGTPLIAWSHLGIAEYAPAPLITLVNPWHFDEFSDAIRKGVCTPRSLERSTSVGENLNALYLEGLRNILKGFHGYFMPVALSGESATRISVTLKTKMDLSNMSFHNPKPNWLRKLRKFQRDPVLFFMDSCWGRLIRWREQSKTIFTHPKAVEKMDVESPLGKSHIFSSIKDGEKIRFNESAYKTVKENNCAFFYPEDRNIDAQAILVGLSDFDDFRYVRAPFLRVGTFSLQQEVKAIDLVNQIDISNKKIISSIDHIVLFDPPPILVQVLRSCGSSLRMIVVLDDVQKSHPDPLHTDVLIVVGENHPKLEAQHWRRKIVVRELEHLPLAIRRAIQEGAAKSPDMLLPLLGFNGNHREELQKLDVRFHQGIIKTVADDAHKGGSMIDICTDLACAMTDLAVTESVYLRYRSLCDRIDDLDARAKFLSFSLFDGVMFDVRA
jgi:glycosyltransferase involved in cell wall biosynthesis